MKHLALVGPTASGKSAVAMEVARGLAQARAASQSGTAVEMVSVDSMQVYRGMDVGTAKPSPEEQRLVPHHLVDVADPCEEWTVVRFRDAVRDAVAGIEGRGRRALLVGGTGLYFRAVVDPLEFPPEDRAVRAALEEEDPERLYAELAEADPEAAARIEPGNHRRTVRAMEVIRITGRPFSSFGPGLLEYGEPVFPVDMVGLRLPRNVLDDRIAQRLRRMRKAGLVDEVRRLAASPGGLSRTAAQAIGYKEVLAHLRGETSEEEAFEEIERRTRRFARRQMAWFERDPRIRWVDAENVHDAATALVESWDPCRACA